MTTRTIDAPETRDAGRAVRLRAATRSAHERLDAAVMALDPFASRAHYAQLLGIHYRFHRAIAPLYRVPALAALIPDLTDRRRLEAIETDLADLGLPQPAADEAQPFAEVTPDVATALGWLYVAEGSTLGAAVLLKAARAIGVDAHFGARHLAGHDDGRAQHWRAFTAALDGAPLDTVAEERVTAGAIDAFAYVRRLVETARA